MKRSLRISANFAVRRLAPALLWPVGRGATDASSNREDVLKALKFLPAVILLMALPAQAQEVTVARFVGTDGNWFNPANWNTGRVPDAATDVVIGAAQVVIDPALGPADVTIRDLAVVDGGTLTTLPGTIMHTRDELVVNGGDILHQSSGSEGGSMVVGGTCTPLDPVACALQPWNGMRMNPTPKSRRDVLLKTGAVSQFGLGGSAPATLTRTTAGWQLDAGVGHYATLTAESATLDGRLELSLHYGFSPRPGDTFQIITAKRRLVGQFIGLPEGAPVACTADNVGLYISYQGGTGNDVVLTARATPPSTCLLLPAPQIAKSPIRKPSPPPPSN